jgi:hypothetical protein
VTTAHGSLELDARVTKGIAKGAVFVPRNQPGANAQELISWDDRNPAAQLRSV